MFFSAGSGLSALTASARVQPSSVPVPVFRCSPRPRRRPPLALAPHDRGGKTRGGAEGPLPDPDSNGSFSRTAAAFAAAALLTLSGMSAPPPIMASPGSIAELLAPSTAAVKPVEQGSMTMQVKGAVLQARLWGGHASCARHYPRLHDVINPQANFCVFIYVAPDPLSGRNGSG